MSLTSRSPVDWLRASSTCRETFEDPLWLKVTTPALAPFGRRRVLSPRPDLLMTAKAPKVSS